MKPMKPGKQRGLTLIELLVVVLVMAILLGATLSVMQPVLSSTQTREASRLVNSYIAGAQSRAVELNRPVGVYFERLPNIPNACVQMFIATTPPPYGGDTYYSHAFLNGTSVTLSDSDSASVLVGANDFIKFDYRGEKYRITNTPSSGSNSTFAITHPTAQPPKVGAAGVPFQIYRKPIKSAVSPLQLPATTAIDLRFSGMGADGNEFASLTPANGVSQPPIMVTFAPNGSIDEVYVGGVPLRAARTDPRGLRSVHLLVGKIDQVEPPEDDPTKNNLIDQTGRWVSISRQTGVVSTVENVGGENVAEAREFALNHEQMGGQ
jgi:prepilin-type N-terminal cleavage/methylation domain-containing protein